MKYQKSRIGNWEKLKSFRRRGENWENKREIQTPFSERIGNDGERKVDDVDDHSGLGGGCRCVCTFVCDGGVEAPPIPCLAKKIAQFKSQKCARLCIYAL